MLYCSDDNEPPKLDVYESKEQFEKNRQSCKTIIMEEDQNINSSVKATSKGQECIFEIVGKRDKHCFSATSEDELMTWVLALKSVTSVIASGNVEEESCENLLYQSHEKPLTFIVEFQETASSIQYQLSGKYLLKLFSTHMTFSEISSQKLILGIQLDQIRRFSFKKNDFLFETGRSSGCEGYFVLLSNNCHEIFNAVNKNAKLNKERHPSLSGRFSENVSQNKMKMQHDGRSRTHSATLSQADKPEMVKSHSHHGATGSESVRNELEHVFAKSLPHNDPKNKVHNDPKNKVHNESKNNNQKKDLMKSQSADTKKGDKKAKKEIEKEEKRLKKEKKGIKEKKKGKGVQESELKENTYEDIKEPVYDEAICNTSLPHQKTNHTYSEPDEHCQSGFEPAPIYSEPDDPVPVSSNMEMPSNRQAWKKYGKEDDKTPSDNLYDHLQRGNIKQGIQRMDDQSLTYGMASAKAVGQIDNYKESDELSDSSHDYYEYEDAELDSYSKSSKSKPEVSYEECTPQTTASSQTTNVEKDDEGNRLYDEIQLT